MPDVKNKLTSFDVANYFLLFSNRKGAFPITNLKLQKLLFFAQGLSFAFLKRPLFKEKFIALQHGPVISRNYKRFKIHNSNAIPYPVDIDLELYLGDEKQLICNTYFSYGKCSASVLRNTSHKYYSWKRAYNSDDIGIDDNLINEEFEKKFKGFGLRDKKQEIIEAEDEWWMNYDDGEPVEDVTEEVNKEIDLYLKNREEYKKNLIDYDIS
jgi:uncharacterized phage-associated protein